MLSPIKVAIVSSSLLFPKYQEPEIFLQGDYSLEAYEYMKKNCPDKSDPMTEILYKTIFEEHLKRPVE